MVTASLISRLSQAVDLIERRCQQNRSRKVVKVRRGYHEDGNVARTRHFAAHPEDRDANIVIFEFYRDEERADEVRIVPVGWAGARGTLGTVRTQLTTIGS
jgi:hypothetical protein